MSPDNEPSQLAESFSLKEAIIAMSNRLKSVDDKQDEQIDNQNEMKIVVAVLPSMRSQLDDLAFAVKDPEKGVIPRLIRVEHTLSLAAQEASRLSVNAINKRTQILAAIIGSIALIIGTGIAGYLHWAH